MFVYICLCMHHHLGSTPLWRRKGRERFQTPTVTSEIRALDICGEKLWLSVGTWHISLSMYIGRYTHSHIDR